MFLLNVRMDKLFLFIQLILCTSIGCFSSEVIEYVPEAPETFILIAHKKGELEIFWNNTDIEYCKERMGEIYEIVYHEINTLTPSKKIFKTCENESEKFVIYDLKPNKNYEVKIRQLVNGTANFSTAVGRTLPDIPFMSPSVMAAGFLVNQIDENLRNISIFWQELPDDNKNGPEFRYVVEVLNETKEVKHPPAHFTLLINKTFNVSITAKNSEGFSSSSIFLFSEKQDLEKDLADFFDIIPWSTEIIMSRKDSKWDTLISDVKIKLCQKINSTYCSEVKNQSCDAIKSCRFQNLFPFTKYKADIYFFFHYGNIVNRSKIMRTLSSEPESPVQNLRVAFMNESLITIKWEPPIRISDDFHAYNVKYGHGNMISEEEYHSVQVYTNQFTLLEIVGYMSYVFQVEMCLITFKHCTPTSNLTVITPISAPSEIQESLEINILPAVEVNSVSLSWKPPEIPNGPIDYYVVKYFWDIEGHSYEKQNIISNTTTILHVDCNTLKIMEYRFQVAAVNIVNNTKFIGKSNITNMKAVTLCTNVVIGFSIYWVVIIIIISALGLGLLFYIIYSYLRRYQKSKKSINVALPEDICIAVYNFYPENKEQRSRLLSKYCPFCCKEDRAGVKTSDIKLQVKKGDSPETTDLVDQQSLGYIDIRKFEQFRLKLNSNDSGFDGSLYSNDCRSSVRSSFNQSNDNSLDNYKSHQETENSMEQIIEEPIVDKINKMREQFNSSETLSNCLPQTEVFQKKQSKDVIHPKAIYQPIGEQNKSTSILFNNPLYSQQVSDNMCIDKEKTNSLLNNHSLNMKEICPGYSNITTVLLEPEKNSSLTNTSVSGKEIQPGYSIVESSSLELEGNSSLNNTSSVSIREIPPGYSIVESPPLELEQTSLLRNTLVSAREIPLGYGIIENPTLEIEGNSSVSNTSKHVRELSPDYSGCESLSIETEGIYSLTNPSQSGIVKSEDSNNVDSSLSTSEENCLLNISSQSKRETLPDYSRIEDSQLNTSVSSLLSNPSQNRREILPGFSRIEGPLLSTNGNSSLTDPSHSIRVISPDYSRIREPSLSTEEYSSLCNTSQSAREISPGYSRIEGPLLET